MSTVYGRVSLIATWTKGWFATVERPTERGWKPILPKLLADYREGRIEAVEARIKGLPPEVQKEEF